MNVTNVQAVVHAMETDFSSKMVVNVHAVPNPKIEWFFEGEMLEGKKDFLQEVWVGSNWFFVMLIIGSNLLPGRGHFVAEHPSTRNL